MREHGAGGASAIFIDVVELATLIARTPDWSRLDASGAGVGWAGTSARPYCARSASAWSYFAVVAACSRFASRIAAFACSTASSALRFSLRATRPRQRWLSLASRRSFHAAQRHRAPHLRCCDFHSVLFCAFHSARVRRCFFGPRRAIPQWIATWA